MISFTVKVDDFKIEDYPKTCTTQLRNQARLVVGEEELQSEEVIVHFTCPDFGDAPDSTTHQIEAMSAYPGVQAAFHTDYRPTNRAWGSSHRNPKADAWLGDQVTGEYDVDHWYNEVRDEDGISNLHIVANRADRDGGDDGVLFPPLNHCQPTTMDVVINVAGPERERYVNAWFDWNRDGDWQDTLDCAGEPAAEWAVRNHPTTLATGRHTVTLPLMTPYNPIPSQGMWARVTLAEQPAPMMDNMAYADGRGPIAGYAYGETEDYGLGIEQETTDRVHLSLHYTTAVTTTTYNSALPLAVTIANNSVVTATNVTLFVYFPRCMSYMAEGPDSNLSGLLFNESRHRLEWQGELLPWGQRTIALQLRHIDIFLSCRPEIISRAEVQHSSLGPPLAEIVTVPSRIPTTHPPVITKRALVTSVVPGGEIDYVITVENVAETPQLYLEIIDPLPIEGRFVAGALVADSQVITASYYNPYHEIRWQRTLPPQSTVAFRYRLQTWDRVECGKTISERLRPQDEIDVDASILEAPVTVACPEPVHLTDFGDAPDSDSNHHDMDNVAYADDGTLGRFPTVWEGTPPDEPSGPTHGTEHVWLGIEIDAEAYADVNLNNDYNTNILQNGAKDVGDNDFGDEGWWNPDVSMLNCEPTMLLVYISRSNLPTDIDQLWLNGWYDGNRDGDWNDTGSCPLNKYNSDSLAYEWIIQDFPINITAIPTTTYLELMVPTVNVYNQQPGRSSWLRLMLSEQKAIQPSGGGHPDGRGPIHPAIFAIGETEDYITAGVIISNPVPSYVEFWIEPSDTITPLIDSEITVGISVFSKEDATPVTIEINSPLPEELTLLEEVYLNWDFFHVTETYTPFSPSLQADSSPNGTITWRGQIGSSGHIPLRYDGRITECPAPDHTGQPMLRIPMTVRQNDSVATYEATLPVDCVPTKPAIHRLYLPTIQR